MDIDSAASTPILNVDGDSRTSRYLRYELTALAYHLAGRPGGRSRHAALVIGPGGGRDLLSALVFGAAHVDGVEINPIIARDVMLEALPGFSGGSTPTRASSIHVDDGRSFVRRSPDKYDVIQASLVDTWAATAAGAYTLTENSLYTIEAFSDYFDHLSEAASSRSRAGSSTACAWSRWRRRRAPTRLDAADRLAIVQRDGSRRSCSRSAVHARRDSRAAAAGSISSTSRCCMRRTGAARSTPPLPDPRPGWTRPATMSNWCSRRIVMPSTSDTTSTSADDRRSALLLPHDPPAGSVRSRVRQRHALRQRIERPAVADDDFRDTRCPVHHRPARPGPGHAPRHRMAAVARLLQLPGRGVHARRSRAAAAIRAAARTSGLFADRDALLLLLGTGAGSFLSRRFDSTVLRTRVLQALIGIVAVAIVGILLLPSLIESVIQAPRWMRIGLAVLLLTPAGALMGVPLPSGVRLLAASQRRSRAVGVGNERRAVSRGRDTRRLHRDELGIFGDAGSRRGRLRRGRPPRCPETLRTTDAIRHPRACRRRAHSAARTLPA